MKKILGVSDIVGTIDKGTPYNYEELGELLSLLKEKHSADQVMFSLCTSDSSEDLLMNNFGNVYHGFKCYGINFGKQFYSLGYIENGEFGDDIVTDQFDSINKIETIIKYAKELQETNEIVAVYYADDLMTYDSTNEYVNGKLNDQIYYHFINPGSIENMSSDHLSTSTEKNILGFIQGLKFHLGIEDVKGAKQKCIQIKE